MSAFLIGIAVGIPITILIFIALALPDPPSPERTTRTPDEDETVARLNRMLKETSANPSAFTAGDRQERSHLSEVRANRNKT